MRFSPVFVDDFSRVYYGEGMNQVTTNCFFSFQRFFFFVGFLVLVIAGCSGGGSSGSSSSDNDNDNVQSISITIGELSDEGTSQIRIPLAVFGDSENDLLGATFDVLVNGTQEFSGIITTVFYHSDEEAVLYTLTDLHGGDVLTFEIHLANGDVDTYTGTVTTGD